MSNHKLPPLEYWRSLRRPSFYSWWVLWPTSMALIPYYIMVAN